MDPGPLRGLFGGHRLPRTRGDGPVSPASTAACQEASPHTRGWTPAAHRAMTNDDGFPAHAGMDPSPCCAAACAARLPRTRGDGPPSTMLCQLPPSASPHTRGWTLDRAPPLVSGKASPHTRGWTRAFRLLLSSNRGFPAHAGMDPVLHRPSGLSVGLPRTRGDGPRGRPHRERKHKASPHTRGWTPHRPPASDDVPGFPAHAGMDPSRRRRRRRRPGASPHTRGWTRGLRSRAG